MTLRARVLAAIVAEPGDWRTDNLAEHLGEPLERVQNACDDLRRAGLLAPSAYRTRGDRWPYVSDATGQRTTIGQRRVWSLLHGNGPTLRAEVWLLTGMHPESGAWKRTVAHLGCSLSTPADLWPSEAGVLAAREAA